MQAPDFSFVVHEPPDDVGVAVRDLSTGESVGGRILGDAELVPDVVAQADIPLGHKIALRAIDEGAEVVKYGVAIGIATQQIQTGAHVHTHNVRSTRWQVTR